MNITVHVERLILEGLPIPPDQHLRVRVAVETELARLLSADGLSASLLSGGTWSCVPSNSIELTNVGTPVRLGQQIARAVYRGIGGSGR
jgi:hypothetical protein